MAPEIAEAREQAKQEGCRYFQNYADTNKRGGNNRK